MEGTSKKSRVCLDGVFDMIHSGHFNAIRQAKQLGDVLVLCIDSEEEVVKNKGPTIFTEKERRLMVEACKWVDEVQGDFPYFPTLAIMDKFNLDYMAHGDDIVIRPDGTDCYSEVKNANRFKVFKRTEGISTSAIVGRILLTMERKQHPEKSEVIDKKLTRRRYLEIVKEIQEKVRLVVNKKRYNDFLHPYREPKTGEKVGLIMGCWDMLHPGHIALLEQAKKHCDYLVVGIYDDETVNKVKGPGFPILNLQERTLSLMALKLVDDVMIGCGRKVSSLILNTVSAGVVFDATYVDTAKEDLGDGAYDEVSSKGMFKQLEHSGLMTTDVLFERVAKNQELIAECQRRKAEKEENYYKNLKFEVKET